jgi:hypothetical protein
MNKTELSGRIARPASLFLLIAMLAACGGGGGGGNPDVDESPNEGGGGGGSSLPTGYFTRTVETSGSFWSAPINSGAVSNFRLMQMYRASDIGGSGNVAAIRFQRTDGNAGATTCPNTTIRLAHTSLKELTDTFADNVEEGKGSSVTVIDDEPMVIAAGTAGTFFEIPLNTPFHYNGVDNLVVEFKRSAACTSTVGLSVDPEVGYVAAISTQVSDNEVSGTTRTYTISAAFVFEGGDNNVIAADRVNDNSNDIAPVNTGRSQFLILASDIDGDGPVTGIQFKLTTALSDPLSGTYTVTLSHVDAATSELGSTTFADNVGTGATVVANGVSLTVPAGASEFWLPLTGSFHYDGTSNLLIDVRATDVVGAGNFLRYQNTAGDRILQVKDDASAATGVIDGPRGLEPRLRFHGSTIDRVSVNGAGDPWIFPITAAGLSSQTLYLSSDLGTGGTITKLACRMNTVSSTEIEYTNFQVVMSHTEATALVEEMAANLTDPVVVFEDSFTVPAGLLRGDWIEIPLSAAFEYDGLRNLVIQTRSDAGTMGHACIAKEGAIRYEDQYGAGVTRDSAVAGLMSYQRDLRLWISK